MMDFKDNLRTKREANNLSQAELAEKLAVSRQTIIKWEKGENYPDMVNLISLSRIFGVSIDELAGNQACAEIEGNNEQSANAKPEAAWVSSSTDSSTKEVGVSRDNSGSKEVGVSRDNSGSKEVGVSRDNSGPKEVAGPRDGSDSKDGIMLILAGLSLILPYGIGLIVAIFVKRTEPAQRNKFVRVLSTVSILVNAARVILYILMLALW